VLQLADEFYPEIVRLRRTIHANPELAFEEVATSALVAETLERCDLEPKRGIAKTGVIADLKGSKQHATGTRRVELRSHMDALPVQEANGLEFA
jgi:hippurate hydrolase